MSFRCIAGVFLLLLVTPAAWAQGVQQRTLERRAIEAAKHVSAKSLDSVLPSQSFEKWLQSLIGPETRVAWESNDCGEQTGDPATTPSDPPVCAQASATLPDGRTVTVMIAVGTYKKGIRGKPQVFFIGLERKDGGSVPVHTLHELPVALGQR